MNIVNIPSFRLGLLPFPNIPLQSTLLCSEISRPGEVDFPVPLFLIFPSSPSSLSLLPLLPMSLSIPTNPISHTHRPWTETTVFFKALSQVGTDFTMMTLLLPKRTRKELKVRSIV